MLRQLTSTRWLTPARVLHRRATALGNRCIAAMAARRPPAQVGDAVSAVDTPALLVDLDVFERNCAKLKQAMTAFPGVNVRPHCKAHKCPEVAHLQLKLLGSCARGVCAQKVSEVEAMVAGGIMDVLLSNEVVAPAKIARLVSLAAQGATIGVCCEDASNLRQLNAEAGRQGTQLNVLIDVNVGQDRCGVDEPQKAAELALLAEELPHVRFAGIQAYHGGLQHVRKPEDRRAAVSQVTERAAAAVAAIKQAGLKVQLVTGGGSGSYKIEAGSGVYNEVQPGSFCFGDADYARNLQEDGTVGEWEQSLWVLAQVCSVNSSRSMAVVDAGLKAFSLDSGPPIVPVSQTGGMQTEFVNGGDEHGKLMWPKDAAASGNIQLPALGALLRLQPGHCDPTVNLYDWVVAVRGERVEAVWAITARGPGN